MIDIQLSQVASYPDPAEFDAMLRNGLEEVGNAWHDKFRDLHFGSGAADRYGYKPRRGEPGSGREFKGSYAASKLKLRGDVGPLKFTGQSYEESKARKFKFTIGRAVATVKILLPRAFNRRHPNSQIRMNDEIRTVLVGELAELVTVLVKSMRRQIAERLSHANQQRGSKAA